MEVRILSFIRKLAGRNRVLLLGGHAMIFHGLDRPTVDSDIWLDPGNDLSGWCDLLEALLREYPDGYFWDLAGRRRCERAEVPEVVEQFGVIRVGGLEEPLDVFRRPNNFGEALFDEAWSLAAPLPQEEVRVLSTIDLVASKADSERQKDMLDIAFLEGKIRADFAAILRACSPETARDLFARYADHETCRAALANPDPTVRSLAIETLRELAADENPFAREMLAGLGPEHR
jgi:hypothetical protein